MIHLLIWISLLFSQAQAGDVKLGNLPLGQASTVGPNDSFPYVNATTNTTQRLLLDDLINLPIFNTNYAPIHNPIFTGNVGINENPAPHTLGVTGDTTGYVVEFSNTHSTLGANFGLNINAGSNGSDAALTIDNYSGSHLFQVLGNGFIGVGTVSPARVFDVTHSVSNQYLSKMQNTNSASGTSFGLEIQAGTNGSDAPFTILDTSSNSLFQVLGNGFIGVGTSAPARVFDVTHNVSNQYLSKFQNTNTTGGTSFGVQISAGTNGSDSPLTLTNSAGTSTLFQVLGNGQTSVNGAPSGSDIFSITGSPNMGGTTERGIDVVYTGASSATSVLGGVRVGTTTANSTTHAVGYGFNSAGWTLGSGGAITNAIDYLAGGARLHIATHNASFADNNSFSGNWFINQSGTDPSLISGNLKLASLTASQAVVTDSSQNLASMPYASTNSASSLVQRDASGNFAAGAITATGVQVSGLTASQTVVTDSSKNLASLSYATTNSASSLVERDASGNFAAGTITATGVLVSGLTASQAVVTDSSKNLASLAYATTNSASSLVQRDGSGNFSAGTITASGVQLSGLTASQAVVTDSSKNLASLSYATTNSASSLVQRDGSGNFSAGTITASLTGTASGNTTYTPNNHGVVVSGSGNAMTVIAPDGSTSKVLISNTTTGDPIWSLLTNSSLNGSAGITNANLAPMASSSTTVGTVKGNISGVSATPSDITLTSSNTASTVMYRDGSGNANISTLTAGTSLVSPVFSTSSANPATGGVFRLANAESIAWRTGDNSTNNTLTMNSSNQLVFGGGTIFSSSGTLASAAFPALAGDVTTSAGSLTTTVAKIAGTTVSGTTGSGNVMFATAPTFSTSMTGPAFVSSSSNPASGGVVRLANTESIAWRTADNTTNNTLSMNASNQLVWGGGTIFSSGGTLLAAAFPAMTGDMTTSAGSLATTAAATQANITTLSKSTGVAVHGTNTNDSASAGYVGEYFECLQSTFTNVTTSNQFADVGGCNLPLTAGDWEISLVVVLKLNGATASASTWEAGIGTATGNSATGLTRGINDALQDMPVGFSTITIPPYRVKLSGSTTYYGKVLAVYSAGTPQYAGRISATRVR